MAFILAHIWQHINLILITIMVPWLCRRLRLARTFYTFWFTFEVRLSQFTCYVTNLPFCIIGSNSVSRSPSMNGLTTRFLIPFKCQLPFVISLLSRWSSIPLLHHLLTASHPLVIPHSDYITHVDSLEEKKVIPWQCRAGDTMWVIEPPSVTTSEMWTPPTRKESNWYIIFCERISETWSPLTH